MTNRQIADVLVIGVRTVETHVERILRKLGLNNRRLHARANPGLICRAPRPDVHSIQLLGKSAHCISS
jgi:DNA-binding NarL/FixJ family response regulator